MANYASQTNPAYVLSVAEKFIGNPRVEYLLNLNLQFVAENAVLIMRLARSPQHNLFAAMNLRFISKKSFDQRDYITLDLSQYGNYFYTKSFSFTLSFLPYIAFNPPENVFHQLAKLSPTFKPM